MSLSSARFPWLPHALMFFSRSVLVASLSTARCPGRRRRGRGFRESPLVSGNVVPIGRTLISPVARAISWGCTSPRSAGIRATDQLVGGHAALTFPTNPITSCCCSLTERGAARRRVYSNPGACAALLHAVAPTISPRSSVTFSTSFFIFFSLFPAVLTSIRVVFTTILRVCWFLYGVCVCFVYARSL